MNGWTKFIRVRWDQVEAYLANGWRLAGARASHHTYYGPLMVKE